MVTSLSEPFVLVIFGGSGDLAYQKIYPAIYDLAEKGLLPRNYAIVGTGRRYTQEEFYNFFEHSLTSDNRHHRHSIKGKTFKDLEGHINFFQGDNTDPKFYKDLSLYLDKLAGDVSYANRVFYVGVPQSLYSAIFSNIKKSGLNKNLHGWTRVIIEKPIGEDEESARSLNKMITSVFGEDQIFRLDHYLGKETLENVLVLRFQNKIFEQLIGNKFLDHVQVTAAENFGIYKRGKFYDATGALKDVGQNHILQMLAIATLEQPKDDSDKALSDSRLALIKSLRAKHEDVVFGQYTVGSVDGKPVIGYRSEEAVSPNSDTDTFFALKLFIENDRFKNVPVYIRSGKQMEMWVTEISYIFAGPGVENDVLTVRVQPNEGVAIKLLTKKPGFEAKVEPTYMQFCYKHYFPGQTFDAYEKLLQDVFAGRHKFFNTAEEVEAQWHFIDPLSKNRTPTRFYKAGSWGPKEAFDLIEKDGRKWLEPYVAFCQI